MTTVHPDLAVYLLNYHDNSDSDDYDVPGEVHDSHVYDTENQSKPNGGNNLDEAKTIKSKQVKKVSRTCKKSANSTPKEQCKKTSKLATNDIRQNERNNPEPKRHGDSETTENHDNTINNTISDVLSKECILELFEYQHSSEACNGAPISPLRDEELLEKCSWNDGVKRHSFDSGVYLLDEWNKTCLLQAEDDDMTDSDIDNDDECFTADQLALIETVMSHALVNNEVSNEAESNSPRSTSLTKNINSKILNKNTSRQASKNENVLSSELSHLTTTGDSQEVQSDVTIDNDNCSGSIDEDVTMLVEDKQETDSASLSVNCSQASIKNKMILSPASTNKGDGLPVSSMQTQSRKPKTATDLTSNSRGKGTAQSINLEDGECTNQNESNEVNQENGFQDSSTIIIPHDNFVQNAKSDVELTSDSDSDVDNIHLLESNKQLTSTPLISLSTNNNKDNNKTSKVVVQNKESDAEIIPDSDSDFDNFHLLESNKQLTSTPLISLSRNNNKDNNKSSKRVEIILDSDSDIDDIHLNGRRKKQLLTSVPLHTISTRNDTQRSTNQEIISKHAIDYLMQIDEDDVDDVIDSMITSSFSGLNTFGNICQPYKSQRLSPAKGVNNDSDSKNKNNDYLHDSTEVMLEPVDFCEVTVDSDLTDTPEEDCPFLPPKRVDNAIKDTNVSITKQVTKKPPKTKKSPQKKVKQKEILKVRIPAKAKRRRTLTPSNDNKEVSATLNVETISSTKNNVKGKSLISNYGKENASSSPCSDLEISPLIPSSGQESASMMVGNDEERSSLTKCYQQNNTSLLPSSDQESAMLLPGSEKENTTTFPSSSINTLPVKPAVENGIETPSQDQEQEMGVMAELKKQHLLSKYIYNGRKFQLIVPFLPIKSKKKRNFKVLRRNTTSVNYNISHAGTKTALDSVATIINKSTFGNCSREQGTTSSILRNPNTNTEQLSEAAKVAQSTQSDVEECKDVNQTTNQAMSSTITNTNTEQPNKAVKETQKIQCDIEECENVNQTSNQAKATECTTTSMNNDTNSTCTNANDSSLTVANCESNHIGVYKDLLVNKDDISTTLLTEDSLSNTSDKSDSDISSILSYDENSQPQLNDPDMNHHSSTEELPPAESPDVYSSNRKDDSVSNENIMQNLTRECYVRQDGTEPLSHLDLNKNKVSNNKKPSVVNVEFIEESSIKEISQSEDMEFDNDTAEDSDNQSFTQDYEQTDNIIQPTSEIRCQMYVIEDLASNADVTKIINDTPMEDQEQLCGDAVEPNVDKCFDRIVKGSTVCEDEDIQSNCTAAKPGNSLAREVSDCDGNTQTLVEETYDVDRQLMQAKEQQVGKLEQTIATIDDSNIVNDNTTLQVNGCVQDTAMEVFSQTEQTVSSEDKQSYIVSDESYTKTIKANSSDSSTKSIVSCDRNMKQRTTITDKELNSVPLENSCMTLDKETIETKESNNTPVQRSSREQSCVVLDDNQKREDVQQETSSKNVEDTSKQCASMTDDELNCSVVDDSYDDKLSHQDREKHDSSQSQTGNDSSLLSTCSVHLNDKSMYSTSNNTKKTKRSARKRKSTSSTGSRSANEVKKPRRELKEKAIKYYKDKIKQLQRENQQYKEKYFLLDWASGLRNDITQLKNSIEVLQTKNEEQESIIQRQELDIQRLKEKVLNCNNDWPSPGGSIRYVVERQDDTITSSDNT